MNHMFCHLPPEEPQHDTLNLDLELAREKGRKGLLHAEILGTRGTDAETAVSMTWASVGLTHHISSIGT